jgi:hypothetical protein
MSQEHHFRNLNYLLLPLIVDISYPYKQVETAILLQRKVKQIKETLIYVISDFSRAKTAILL